MSTASDAVARRRERALARLRSSSHDHLVALSPAAIAFLTDVDVRPFGGGAPAAVLSDDGTITLVVSCADEPFVAGSAFAGRVVVWPVGPGSGEARGRLIAEASGASPADAEEVVAVASRVRDADEMRRLRRAAHLADVGYTAVVDRMHPELRVLEIVRNVDRSLRTAGGGEWWSPLEHEAGVSAETQYPHSSAAVVLGRGSESGVLQRAAPLPFALYPLSESYAGAAGGTIVFVPPEADLRSRSSLLSDAMASVVDAIRPGTTGADVHRAFRSAVAGRVEESVATQVVGYGLGTGIAGPILSAGSRDVIEPGSVVSVRAALPGGGVPPVVYQTTVFVSQTGSEVANVVPLRLIELY